MTARDDLLRAHVYKAFDARGTDALLDACRDVVDGYLLWPALEYEHALDRARLMVVLERGESEWRIDEAADAIRESYVDSASVAA